MIMTVGWHHVRSCISGGSHCGRLLSPIAITVVIIITIATIIAIIVVIIIALVIIVIITIDIIIILINFCYESSTFV